MVLTSPLSVEQVVGRMPVISRMSPIPSPIYSMHSYSYEMGCKIFLGVESMSRHTTDEGSQLQLGLEHAGYVLVGHGFFSHKKQGTNLTNVPTILDAHKPSVVIVQDKREWDVRPGDFRDARASFRQVDELRRRCDVFKMTVLKDAHQQPTYHRNAAEEIGCHGWITYYNPDIICKLAPYLRKEHLVRTYHSIDKSVVPTYDGQKRKGCLLSGAVSAAYPLRAKLFEAARSGKLRNVKTLTHPGYHCRGSATPSYIRVLSNFQVAICTASIYGYALRKIIEATAAGCVVITDLPSDEVMPEIDGNLVRVHPDISLRDMEGLIERCCSEYDPARQKIFAEKSSWYDYREVGIRLASDIESLQRRYA